MSFPPRVFANQTGPIPLQYLDDCFNAISERSIWLTDYKTDSSGNTQTDVQAFEAALAAALALSDSSKIFNDGGADILIPPGVWDFQGMATASIDKSRVSVVGLGGPGAVLIQADGPLFDVGDYTDTFRVRISAFRNLTIFNTDYANLDACIKLYRTSETLIDGIRFINWYIGIDGYRASTPTIRSPRWEVPNRTVQALAMIRTQGLDETVTTGETYTPGGGVHLESPDGTFSNAGHDTYAGILIKACDGFYWNNGHIGLCERDVALEPAGTPENHVVIDIQLNGGYLDQPSSLATTPYNFVIGGTVKETIAMASGANQRSVYRDISSVDQERRGGSEAKHAVFIAVLDGDNWGTTSVQHLEDIRISGGTVNNCEQQGIQIHGAATGAYVEPRALYIGAGLHFSGNNTTGNAGVGVDINGAVESAIIDHTSHADPAVASDFIINLVVSDAGATDNPNPAAMVCGPDFSRVTLLPSVRDVNITPSEIGACTMELDVLPPGPGKLIRRPFKGSAVGAVDATLWQYTIPDGVCVGGTVRIVGADSTGALRIHYSWVFSLYRAGGAATFFGGSPQVIIADKDGSSPAPTLTLVGNVLTLIGKGVALNTTDFNAYVDVTFGH